MLHPIQSGYLWAWAQKQFQSLSAWSATVLDGKKPKSTIGSLDGVRAIACLSVVSYHISLITTNDIHLWARHTFNPFFTAVAFFGDTGVTLFFVLSGFLLFLPYAKAILFENTTWPSVRQFYLRRALRILPAYYASLLLMALLFHPDYLNFAHWKQWIYFLTLFMDSAQTTYKQINGPFWSLAVEWQFYLILPWITLGIGFLVRRGPLSRRLTIVLLCLGGVIVWGILSRFLGFYLFTLPTQTVLLPHSVWKYILPFIYGPPIAGLHGKFLEDFAMGMLVSTLYVLSRQLVGEHRMHTALRLLGPWLFVGSLLWLLGMAMLKFDHDFPHTWLFLNPIANTYDYLSEFGFALGYGLFVAGVLFGPIWLKRVFSWRLLRWIGLLSFGLYMWHLKLLESFTGSVVQHVASWNKLVLYSLYWGWLLIFILPFAFLLFVLIERPWINLGSRFHNKGSTKVQVARQGTSNSRDSDIR